MRQKVGTVLDEQILKRARVRAAQEGKAFNELWRRRFRPIFPDAEEPRVGG